MRTDGNDSNNGLTNTAGGAFLTIQKAVNVVCQSLDLGSNAVTIQVADGAYNATVVLSPFLGSSTVTIRGNTTTPANVTVTTTGSSAIQVYLAGESRWHLEGFKLSTSGAFNDAIRATQATLTLQTIDFGSCGGNHVQSANGSSVTFLGNYSITGGAAYHVYGYIAGMVEMRSITVTLTGTPAFSGAFAGAYANALVEATSITFSGAATGTRYHSNANAVIQTGSGGANYFPGNNAGSVSTGGQYI